MRAPAAAKAPLAGAFRILGAGIANSTQACGELLIGTVEHAIGRAQVGAALGEAERVPLEEVLRRQRQFVGHLAQQRQLAERTEQFLGLGARRRGALGQVQRRLRIGHAIDVAVGQQGFAPEHGVTTELGADRGLGQVETGEHEGIE
ncbi:hypothetical protein D3C79_761070 [compost metagenome]